MDALELCRRIISHLPFSPCGATLDCLLPDVGLDPNKDAHRKAALRALELAGSLGVFVHKGRCGAKAKQYWVVDVFSRERAMEITNAVMLQEAA
jgi:hypothetical protein